VTITERQLKLIKLACRQRLRIFCAKGQQHLAVSFLAAFILKHSDPAVNAHRMRLTETIRRRLAHDSAQLVDLLIVILPTIPGSPETRDTGPEGFNRLFITTGNITEQGKIQRSPAVELLSGGKTWLLRMRRYCALRSKIRVRSSSVRMESRSR
jgi:hypothetical protein